MPSGWRLLTRAPYLFAVIALALMIGATVPLAKTALSSPTIVALAYAGIAAGSLITVALVRALTHHTRSLSAEITGAIGLLEGERQTHHDTKADAELKLKVAQEQRRLVEDRLASLTRALPGVVLWYDKGGNVVGAEGSALATLFPGESVVGKTVQHLKSRHPNAEWNFRRAVSGEEFTAIEQLPDARVETRYRPLRDGKSVTGVLSIALDLRERDRLEMALRESDERARRMFEEMPVAAAFIGADDRFLLANRAFADALGVDAKQLVSMALGAFTHPEDVERDKVTRERLMRGEIPLYRGVKRLVRKDGEVVPFEATETVLRDPAGRPLYELLMLKDATGRAHDEQIAAHFARHDPTTDLPNRVSFEERLEQTLAKMNAEKQRLGLVVFDVVNVDVVAQRLGRAAGDALLREVARRVGGALPDGDTLARTGRTQFALAVSRRGAAGTAEVVERLLTAVADGFAVDGQRVHADLRLGFAMFPEDATDGEQLLRRSEAALHHAKKNERRYIRYGDNVLV